MSLPIGRLPGASSLVESIFELGITTEESDLGTSSLGFYLMRYGQLKNAMGWYLASDYFLNRLGEDETDVRWGIMDNDEYWVDNEIERKSLLQVYGQYHSGR